MVVEEEEEGKRTMRGEPRRGLPRFVMAHSSVFSFLRGVIHTFLPGGGGFDCCAMLPTGQLGFSYQHSQSSPSSLARKKNVLTQTPSPPDLGTSRQSKPAGAKGKAGPGSGEGEGANGEWRPGERESG